MDRAILHTSKAARPIFLGWERLRPLYNGYLALLVLYPVSGPFRWPPMEDLPIFLIGAVLANLCYFAGPLAEAYLAWLGLRGRVVRATLFAGGAFISLPLVFMFMLAYTLSSS